MYEVQACGFLVTSCIFFTVSLYAFRILCSYPCSVDRGIPANGRDMPVSQPAICCSVVLKSGIWAWIAAQLTVPWSGAFSWLGSVISAVLFAGLVQRWGLSSFPVGVFLCSVRIEVFLLPWLNHD